MATETDESLAQRIQAGESDLFAELINRYEGKLRRYAHKFLACQDDIDDMVQEVFIKAYTHLQSYDATRPFSPWIYRIAHNTYVNQLKKQQRSFLSLVDADTIFPQLQASEATDQAAMSREDAVLVESSLESLDAKYRSPVALYFYEELSYQEIAEVLGIPVTTVGVRINRAKQMLKAQVTSSNAYE